MSEDVRNQRADDVVVVPIFSGGRRGPTRVPIAADVGGVPHDGVLFCEELATIDRDFLRDGPLGPPVPAALLDRVVAAILIAMGGWPW